MSELIIREMRFGTFEDYVGCSFDPMTMNVCSVSYACDGDEGWLHCIGSVEGLSFVSSKDDIHDRIVDMSIFEDHPDFHEDFGIDDFHGIHIDYVDGAQEYFENKGDDPAAILLGIMTAIIMQA